MIDLDALKARLAEYDDYAPKCSKKVERKTNCAPDSVLSSDPTYHDYDFTTYSPCCRPEGHAGECRNGRLILGWPGFVTVSALVAEVERLRAERHLDNVDLAQAYDFARNKGETLEREAVVAWLRAQVSQAVSDGDLDLDWAADAIERGEHRRKETP
jgi:hypothetical protein